MSVLKPKDDLVAPAIVARMYDLATERNGFIRHDCLMQKSTRFGEVILEPCVIELAGGVRLDEEAQTAQVSSAVLWHHASVTIRRDAVRAHLLQEAEISQIEAEETLD